MRNFRHLNFIYIRDRVAQLFYQKRFQDHPWFTKRMIEFLDGWLCASDVGFEYGSGRSTIWLAQKVSFVTSVEQDEFWRKKVQAELEQKSLEQKVSLEGIYHDKTSEHQSYVDAIKRQQDDSLDFCLIDGSYRDLCALASLPKLKPGGVIIIDDVERYIPRENISHAPEALTLECGFESEAWDEFSRIVQRWRCFWTSDGVSDTALWVKPCAEN